MPSIVNTNISSLNAQRSLGLNQSSLTASMQRLSSGLRINSAKDDAAGLAITDRMTSQIRGSNQAARNANDGISLAQTAEGALAEVTTNLQRLRELAVQSSNSTLSSTDRDSLQAEYTQLSSEITRVASQTQFNGINLLDGTFTNQNFQIGANASQTIAINAIGNAKSTALGVQQITLDGTLTGSLMDASEDKVDNGIAASSTLTISTVNGGKSDPVIYSANSDAKAIAASINMAAKGVGITATASNSVTLNGLTTSGSATGDKITMTLNGKTLSADGVTADDYSKLVQQINLQTESTGVVAAYSRTGSNNSLTLTAADGRDIVLADFQSSSADATVKLSKAEDSKAVDPLTTVKTVTLTSGASDTSTSVGTVMLSSSQGSIFTSTDATGDVFAQAGVNNSTLSSVADTKITSVAGAQNALDVIDGALAAVDASRGQLGAMQNRFTSVVNTLQTTAENLTASRSRIQDADFAQETASLSRAQILQQAATSMVAQANQAPQGVLSLLR